MIVESNNLIMRVLVHFGDKYSDNFYVLKVLIDVLILSLGKNISIHEVKFA